MKASAVTKSELIQMLTAYQMRQNPALYAGHDDDARYFVLHNMGSSRRDLFLAAQVRGLVPYSFCDLMDVRMPGDTICRYSEGPITADDELAAFGLKRK